MVALANGMWKFKGAGYQSSSTIYLLDSEIIGAIVDSPHSIDPKLVLLTLHSGAININWVLHHEEIVEYIEGKEHAGEVDEEC